MKEKKAESEDKKGFIMYCDILNDLEALTDEQCGILFRAILRRQAGMKLPEMDAAVKVSLSFISKGIDRNTAKYYNIKEKRREAAERRWKEEQLKKEQAEKEKQAMQNNANSCKTIQNDTNEKKVMQGDTSACVISNQLSDISNQLSDNSNQLSDNGDKHTHYKGPAGDGAGVRERKKTAWGFVPPTLDEVIAFAKSRSGLVDPREFFDTFEVAGWRDPKGNPVYSWEQKFLSWENWRAQSAAVREITGKTKPTTTAGKQYREPASHGSLADDIDDIEKAIFAKQEVKTND